ncbi:GGDEF domain-containing protein [Vogesella oryzae]|uniref:GGDEF domain-containing protein n=1 Tax=Vogesella oryzae TaxID=1735285 RepID=UPI00158421ED|nr:GGDEF domain-containing protein [Vogesella oryzae]
MTHPEHSLTHDGAISNPASRRLQQILDLLPQPVMLFRPDGRVDFANSAARQQLGNPAPDVSCHHYTLGNEQPCHDGQPCLLQQAKAGGSTISRVPFRRDIQHNGRFVEITVAPLFGEDGQLEGLLETHHDVTARKQEEQRLQLLQGQLTELAHRDPLTNLPNRRYLELKLETLAKDRVSRHYALLYANLDGFRAINDAHGHVVGDRVLALVAQRLRSAVRISDLLLHAGGDEFAILLENSNDSGARAVAGKVIAALCPPLDGLPLPNQLGISVGIVMFGTGSGMPPALLPQAVSTMHSAKRRGGNDRELIRL